MSEMSPSPPVPQLTHLQFKVLGLLLERHEPSGLWLRDELRSAGVRQSGPAFYQMMARLEDGGLVAGRYRRRSVDGQPIKERIYQVSAAGLAAWRETRDFYLEILRAVGPEEGLLGA